MNDSRADSSLLSGDTPGSVWIGRVLIAAAMLFLSSLYFSIAVNSLALGLMACAWLSLMVVRKRGLVRATPLDWYFLAYISAEILSGIFSTNPAQSFTFAKRVLLIAVVYYFASMAARRNHASRYIAVLLGSAIAVALIGVLKLIFADPDSTRRLGIFQFYMTTSELMMMSALLIVPFLLHPKTPSRLRWIALAGLVPILISLYATVTRGAYLATAAGILIIALIRNRKLIVPFLAVILLAAIFAPPYVQDRVKSIVDLQHPENQSRLMLWTLGAKIVADHPIVGVGDIDLHELFVQYSPPGTDIPWGHVHNTLLQLLVTLGVVGFAAILALFGRIVIVEWQVYKRVKDDWLAGSFALGAIAVFVGFQVNGLTEWSFGDQEVVLLLWTTLGLTLALDRSTHAPPAQNEKSI
jgi:putative inorganic carbon (HCO3(-)) transporter